MKEQSSRVQEVFRSGKNIDSALRRAAAFAKKNVATNAGSVGKKMPAQAKPAK